mgnify:CR=1 FL=1
MQEEEDRSQVKAWGKKKKKKKQVSQKVIADNIRKTLAKIDAGVRKKKRRRPVAGVAEVVETHEPEKSVRVMEFISLAELSDLIDIPAATLISTCIDLGLMVTVNQRQEGSQWRLLGSFPFATGSEGSVTLLNAETDGYVISDAVRFIK